MIVRIAGAIILLVAAVVAGLFIQAFYWPAASPQYVFIAIIAIFSALSPIVMMQRAKKNTQSFTLEVKATGSTLLPLLSLAWVFIALYAALAQQLGASLLAPTISLFVLYAAAFNKLPTQGLQLMRQREFKVFFGPLVIIATIGYAWGSLARII